jgi:hypothetical protein
MLSDVEQAKDLLIGVKELKVIKCPILEVGQSSGSDFCMPFDPYRDDDIKRFWVKTEIDGQIQKVDTTFFTEWHLKHQHDIDRGVAYHSLWNNNIIYDVELVKCKIAIEKSNVKYESRIFQQGKFAVLNNIVKVYFDFNVNHIGELFNGSTDIYLLTS